MHLITHAHSGPSIITRILQRETVERARCRSAAHSSKTRHLPNGAPFRSSQDCSTLYERATVINEILVLSETAHAERSVSHVDAPGAAALVCKRIHRKPI